MRTDDHLSLTLEARTAHLDLHSPCYEQPAEPQRFCRDLGLSGELREDQLQGACVKRCANTRHLFAGSENEGKDLRLRHLLTLPESKDLPSRKLGALAGVSHAAVQRLRRQTQTTNGETK